jgi:predicted DNA-binding mobile mystery protein A
MRKSIDNLMLSQIDARLAPWRRQHAESPPRGGWLRAIREALGMSAAQLAKRLGIAQQAVAKLERNEAAGKITLASLERVARALGCRVTYAIVPEKPLAEMRRARALVLADSLIKPVAHTMELEAQGVSEKETRRQRKELADEFLRGSPRKLWR